MSCDGSARTAQPPVPPAAVRARLPELLRTNGFGQPAAATAVRYSSYGVLYALFLSSSGHLLRLAPCFRLFSVCNRVTQLGKVTDCLKLYTRAVTRRQVYTRCSARLWSSTKHTKAHLGHVLRVAANASRFHRSPVTPTGPSASGVRERATASCCPIAVSGVRRRERISCIILFSFPLNACSSQSGYIRTGKEKSCRGPRRRKQIQSSFSITFSHATMCAPSKQRKQQAPEGRGRASF